MDKNFEVHIRTNIGSRLVALELRNFRLSDHLASLSLSKNSDDLTRYPAGPSGILSVNDY